MDHQSFMQYQNDDTQVGEGCGKTRQYFLEIIMGEVEFVLENNRGEVFWVAEGLLLYTSTECRSEVPKQHTCQRYKENGGKTPR